MFLSIVDIFYISQEIFIVFDCRW